LISNKHRFHGHGSLRYVYQRGSTIRGPMISMKYSQNSRRSAYRVAVVISRKVSKSAVIRNRIRRRLYETIRRNEALIHKPYDIIITVFSDQLASLPADKLEKMIIEQFHRAGII